MSRQRAKSFFEEKIFPGFPGKDASLPAEAADDLPGSVCILKSPFTVGEIIEEPMVIHHMYDEKSEKNACRSCWKRLD